MKLPYPLPPEHRLLFDVEFAKDQPSPSTQSDPGGASVVKEIKGKSTIIGFWMFQEEAREPLRDVALRYVNSSSERGVHVIFMGSTDYTRM